MLTPKVSFRQIKPAFLHRAMACLFAAAIALAIAIPAGVVHASDVKLLPHPEMNDSGLHVQPWFQETFLDLGEDLEEAASEGKRLAIFFEQKGCGYCRKMHEVNLRDPRIVDYIKANFHVIQLDLKGLREVTDFDGKTMTEREYAERVHMRGTPKIIFYPEKLAQATGKGGLDGIAWTYEGYLQRGHFLNTFEFTVAKGYEGQKTPNFFAWLQSGAAKLNYTWD